MAGTGGHDLFVFQLFVPAKSFYFVRPSIVDLPMTNKSGVNASPPPPINWASKPKANSANIINHLLRHDSGTPGSQLVPVFINLDHIVDLQEALRVRRLSKSKPKLELQEETIIDDAGNVKKLLFIRQQNSPHSHQEDAYIDVTVSSEDQPQAEGLTSSFSCLSMSTPYQQVIRTGPLTVTPGPTPSPLGMSPQPSTKKGRYYVVLVGKCAGIYYDAWQVFSFLIFFFSALCLLRHHSSRENVEPLIHHVSNARFKGFSTYEMAKEFYLDAKRSNKVRIVRDPGDDTKYGPIENAIQ